MDKTFGRRLAALEALEAAKHPDAPAFACFRSDDWEVLNSPATDPIEVAAILRRYELPAGVDLGRTKIYLNLCSCGWDGDGRHCPVCEMEN